MQNLTHTLTTAYTSLQPHLQKLTRYLNSIQYTFQQQTQNLSSLTFTLLCILYSIVIIFLISKLTKQKSWRPKNKELKSFKEIVKDKFNGWLLGLPIVKGIVERKFQKSLEKEEVKVVTDLQKHWDHRKVSALPAEGMNQQNLRKRIYEWVQKQKLIWNTGKVSGAFYVNSQQHMKQMNDFAAPFLYQNPLHLDTYKQLLRMQKQVMDMTNSLLTSQDKPYFGTITSGGSESLMLALYAYRNFYSNRKKPNIVIPVTAHAAIDKGCFYFNIQARKARLNSQYEVDMSHMESLIDGNTIMILGSAPNYPHGIIDPIEKIAKLAKKKNVGCHIDGCLGGFVGLFHPDFKGLFSLDREGVTSVSLDHHKFGLAPKGVSTVFYKTPELRQCQYYVNMDWKGGIYGTPTFPGSRSGFASAAAWYSLTQTTMKGFKQNAKEVIEATQEGAKNLAKVKGIQVFGQPKLCVIAFTTTQKQCSHLSLSDYLNYEKKWNISSIHKPDGIHISVTLANCQNVRVKLSKDVEQGLQYIRSKKQLKQSMASALYGTTTKIPTNGMQHEVLKLLVGASMK